MKGFDGKEQVVKVAIRASHPPHARFNLKATHELRYSVPLGEKDALQKNMDQRHKQRLAKQIVDLLDLSQGEAITISFRSGKLPQDPEDKVLDKLFDNYGDYLDFYVVQLFIYELETA